MFRVSMSGIYTVGGRFCVGVPESEHPYVHFYGGIVVKEHDHARSKTDVQAEIAFERTGEIIAGTVCELALSASELNLHFIEHAEPHAFAKRYIVSEGRCAVEV